MNFRSQGTEALRTSNATALTRYRDFLTAPNTMVVGDFNDSVVWDKGAGPHTFAHTLASFMDHGLVSAYHEVHGQRHGTEKDKTYFHTFGRTFAHHIDFCFTRPGSAGQVTVGSCDDWVATRLSDHVPIVCDLQLCDTDPVG